MNSPYSTRPLLGDDDDDDDDDEGDGHDKKPGKDKPKEVPEFLGKSLLDQRVIMVCKPVDRDMAAVIVGQLLVLDEKDNKAPITMYVNCPGGDADSGFGIYDAMHFISAPITTVCIGLAASAAVTIFVGGAKGRRFTLPHSRFLIHQPSSQSQGQASDIEITANEIIKTRDLYNQILAEETGRSDKQILKDVTRDFWLSASEAVEYGIASGIMKSRTEMKA